MAFKCGLKIHPKLMEDIIFKSALKRIFQHMIATFYEKCILSNSAKKLSYIKDIVLG